MSAGLDTHDVATKKVKIEGGGQVTSVTSAVGASSSSLPDAHCQWDGHIPPLAAPIPSFGVRVVNASGKPPPMSMDGIAEADLQHITQMAERSERIAETTRRMNEVSSEEMTLPPCLSGVAPTDPLYYGVAPPDPVAAEDKRTYVPPVYGQQVH